MRLPLFPLNTVLFPGMPLSLHIFEERYQQMIARCLGDQQPFGVVLIRQGLEANGPLPTPYAVGCTARITQVQPLGEGRANLIAVGHERFQVQSLDYKQPYLVGNVNKYPFVSDAHPLSEIALKLHPWVARYLKVLATADSLAIELDELPTDAATLTFLAAFLIQLPAVEKQTLLELESVYRLAGALYHIYRREATLLSAMLAHDTAETHPPFSPN